MPKAIFDVLLPLPLGESFEYNAGEADIAPGNLVIVPFGCRQVTGLALRESAGKLAAEKRKSIAETLALPPMPPDFIPFILWAAQYTMTPPGLLFKMTLAGVNTPSPPKIPMGWQRVKDAAPQPRKDSKAAKLLDLFSETRPVLSPDDLFPLGLSQADAQALVKKGWLEHVALATLPLPQPNPDFHQPALTTAQREAATALIRAQDNPGTLLLQGVTGAGKTEVYCEAIADALRAGGQVLVLMPEIALTTAMLARFHGRFGAMPTLWHSGLPDSQRRVHWWAIARGGARLILGARSALFLPYPNLKLIVVDEEHEAAYKQEEGVIYHARDMAVARGYHGRIPVILASATPSLETMVNAAQGRYRLLRLPERYGGARLPKIHRVDMRAENLPAGRFLSAPLLDALRETLQAGEQAMLFLNRRGYAPLTLCRACGHRLQCPQCSAWLVLHKQRKRLQCHHCGYQDGLPRACPACRAEERFAACGPGVERIAEEVTALLPAARAAVMSSDLLDSPQDVADLLERIHQNQIDILIGTQIMAKGHHFPDMTLVGIVDADLGLSGGDPRASERCFQLLQQVAGRTGRAAKPGRAYLQTYQPQHPVMQALERNDHDAFMAAELRERQAYNLPPYKRLAALVLSDGDLGLVREAATRLAAALPQGDTLKLLGPAPAPLALLRGHHRYRLLIVAGKQLNLQAVLRQTLKAVALPKSLKLQIDIDPYSFF